MLNTVIFIKVSMRPNARDLSHAELRMSIATAERPALSAATPAIWLAKAV